MNVLFWEPNRARPWRFDVERGTAVYWECTVAHMRDHAAVSSVYRDEPMPSGPFDIAIVNRIDLARSREAVSMLAALDARIVLLWDHFTPNNEKLEFFDELSRRGSVQGLVLDSRYHRSLYLDAGLPDALTHNIVIHQGGVRSDMLPASIPLERKPAFVYASVPHRGLFQFLDMWPRIHERLPDHVLHITGGAALYRGRKPRSFLERMERALERLTDLPNVEFHGCLPTRRLYELLAGSRALLYPAQGEELSCITLHEAMYLGCAPIVSSLELFTEKVENGVNGLVVPGVPKCYLRHPDDPESARFRDAFVATATRAASDGWLSQVRGAGEPGFLWESRVRELAAALRDLAPGATAAAPSAKPATAGNDCVEVTGRRLSINGVSRVPPGLFGIHATPLDETRQRELGIECVRRIVSLPDGQPYEPDVPDAGAPHDPPYVIECFYDRFKPALTVTAPRTWASKLSELAKTYAHAARKLPRECCIEFWNEPFLNWALKPGVNYNPRYYDNFNINPGAPVRLKGEGVFTEHLAWSRGQWVIDDETLETHHVAASHKPPELGVGERYAWNDKLYRVVERWLPADPTQSHRFSGQQNRVWYERMLRVFGDALKTANPEVRLIAGWGLEPHRDDWAAWHQLYRPLIDNHHDLIDGIGEHHYGGDTRELVAVYETVTAYMDTVHGMRLPFYNTEAGGFLGTDNPGCAQSRADEDCPDASLRAMSYALRDLVHIVDVCPDKVVTRCAHEMLHHEGAALAFRLLGPLRGELIHCVSPNPDLWCVASRLNDRLTVVLFNDSTEPLHTSLSVALPDGSRVSGITRLQVRAGRDGGPPVLERRAVEDSEATKLTIEPFHAITQIYTLRGGDRPLPRLDVKQYFAEGTRGVAESVRPLHLRLRLPPSRLRAADGATVKVAWPPSSASSRLFINGSPIRLERSAWLSRGEVPLSILKPDNQLVFECERESCAIWMASIELLRGGVAA